MTQREAIEMSALEAILEQARSKPLSDEQHRQLHAALTTLAFLTEELEKKRTSIRRLRHVLFGPGSEKLANQRQDLRWIHAVISARIEDRPFRPPSDSSIGDEGD